jgi:hypothetical protein
VPGRTAETFGLGVAGVQVAMQLSLDLLGPWATRLRPFWRPGVIIGNMSKKRGQNRKKQVAPNPSPVATTGITRREVIVDTVIGAVVGGEILKYLPGPEPTPAPAPRTVSLGITWIIPSRAAFGKGSITEG